MLNRRGLLQLSATALAAVGLPRLAWAAAPSAAGFVVDVRFAQGRQAPTPPGAWRHEIEGDVTALWYDRLDKEWRQPRGTLAGLTDDNALFVLERLAWDRRRRVILREALPDNLVRWLIAPKSA